MSTYHKDFREVERDAWWTVSRIFFGLVVLSIVVSSIGWGISLLAQPGRIVSKTFDADNVIANYEWFHDANGNFLAKTAQVHQFKTLFDGEKEPGERSRLRIEMAAVQQSCRDLARRYNSNATKVNRAIFKGASAPEALNAGECE